jgi:hypothetical protein
MKTIYGLLCGLALTLAAPLLLLTWLAWDLLRQCELKSSEPVKRWLGFVGALVDYLIDRFDAVIRCEKG